MRFCLSSFEFVQGDDELVHKVFLVAIRKGKWLRNGFVFSFQLSEPETNNAQLALGN